MLSVGVDIGGTFTDVVGLRNDETVYFAKVPSTPADLIQGVRRGVERLLQASGEAPAAIGRFIHGTTIATNAILEQKGARLGLLATAGFEDILEIGRQNRATMYDLFLDAQTPVFLAPRRRRLGITERIDATGQVVVPLREDQVRAAVRLLVDQEQVEALAVAYLFSFVNPRHEERTREIIAETAPGMTVSLSSHVDPTFREYERTCLTAFDAYVRPVMSRYLTALGQALGQMGIAVDLQIMQSRGGISSSQSAIARPVTTVLSGPAAGVIGGKFAGQRSGHKNLITIDIGGTSCDVALVREGKPLLSTQGRIGSYPMRVPLIDVTTIGAGGGSLAWLDAAGGLRVGPRSAGADPGPACYGKGGQDPAVTDATLLLGYLNPRFFAGGDVGLRVDLAEAAMQRVATAIGKSVRETAEGIFRIINARMADAIRLVSVQRGLDPRQFSLVAFGGAGPVHASALARELGISTIIVPEAPGVLSAFGLLVASLEYDHSRTFRGRAETVDFGRAGALLSELAGLGRDKLRQDRAPMDQVTVGQFADMRYVGQSYELEVPLPPVLGPDNVGLVVADFHDLHQRVYGHASLAEPVEFVNLRSVCALAFPAPRLAPVTRGGRLDDAVRATRPVVFAGAPRPLSTRILDRARLPTGVPIAGPAIVEQADTTTVIGPGQTARLDECQNLVITLDGAGGIVTVAHVERARRTDPITLEVLRNRLEAIAEEMQDALIRSSYSSIVKESFDASSAIMDAGGDTIAQATAQPAHLGMLVASVKRLLAEFPAATMRDGDAYVMNDPFDGGTHLPDVTVAVPVIVDGELVALACSMSHHQDLGGKVPGSCPTDSTEIYQEGLIIPPLKLYSEGQPNDTFFRLLRRNVRIPDVVVGDLRGQVACGQVGRSRLVALMREYGSAAVLQAKAELFDRAEAMTREAIRALPDGTYRFHDFLDNDGVDLDRRVRLEAAVTIRGAELLVEFDGTSPQVRGPMNCVPSSTLSVVYYVVTALADPGMPSNAGCYRPITVRLPRASVLNCDPPAAVNARALTMKRLSDVLFGALVQAVPGRIPAASGQHCTIYFGGRDPLTAAPYVSARIVVGGMGARPTKDGIDAIETDITNTKNNPAEAAEADFPIRVLTYRLRQDSGGPGQFRGGLGVDQVIEVMRGETTISHRGDRFTTPPWGLLGGHPGVPWRSTVIRADGQRVELSSKVVLVLHQGDQLHISSAGGGGYGDPLERDPALVLDDVLGHKVSRAAARDDYGVVVDETTRTVDDEATARRRAELGQARGPVDWTFDRGPELGRS